MKFTPPVLSLALALSLISQSALAESFKRVKTEEQFLSLVLGKTATDENGNSYKFTKTKVTGKIGKKKFKGTWKWHKGYWCRNGKLDGKEIGSDCQIIKQNAAGTKMMNTRDQGKGKSQNFTLK